jgi:hypothetical protein
MFGSFAGAPGLELDFAETLARRCAARVSPVARELGRLYRHQLAQGILRGGDVCLGRRYFRGDP